jgi:hypothetical protein
MRTLGAKGLEPVAGWLATFLEEKKGSPSSNLVAVILLGMAAPFISGSKALQGIEKKILTAFESGTEDEQKAIARCMPDLMDFFKNSGDIVREGLAKLQAGMPFSAAMRGQCYFIVGLCKGLGNAAVEQFGLLSGILDNFDKQKDARVRIGRAYLFKALAILFGRVLERNINEIKQIVVMFLSDNEEQVRKIGSGAAEAFFARLSSLGVKRSLPLLIEGLEEESMSWRAKIAHIWMMGHLAHCSAKQLQDCLPKVVPVLSKCLSDTHPDIRNEASDSLELIGTSIKNP